MKSITKVKSRRILVITVGVCLAFGVTIGGQTKADATKGLQIMTAQDRDDAGWQSVRVSGEMILINAANHSVSRSFNLSRIERSSTKQGDNSRMTFNTPADIKGTVLLTHGKVEPKDDHQWLYLPVAGKVRRISSANRSGKFLSSEFSFEDMGGSELADNTYNWVRDETCPGQTKLKCHVIVAFPKNRKSGYKQRIVWLDTKEYRVFLTEFFNRRGQLEKRLTYSGYKNFKGHWRPAKLEMTNLQTKKRTILKWSKYKFGAVIKGSEMSPQNLK